MLFNLIFKKEMSMMMKIDKFIKSLKIYIFLWKKPKYHVEYYIIINYHKAPP